MKSPYSQLGNPTPSSIQLQNESQSHAKGTKVSLSGESKSPLTKDLKILTFGGPPPSKKPAGSLHAPSIPIKEASHTDFHQHFQCLTCKQRKETARIIIWIKLRASKTKSKSIMKKFRGPYHLTNQKAGQQLRKYN